MIAHLLFLLNRYTEQSAIATNTSSNPGDFVGTGTVADPVGLTGVSVWAPAGVAVGTISPFNPVIAKFANAVVFASKLV